MRKPLAMMVLGLSALALSACKPSGGGDQAAGKDGVAAANAILSDSGSGDDWPGYGRTYGEQHFSPLTEINDGNVKSLGLAWSMDMGTGNPTSIPVEVGGTLYMSTGLSVVRAVDARTGKLLWTYDSRVADHAGKEMRSSWGIRGIAWWNGKVYTGTVDGRLIALDAKTGQEVWTVQTLEKGNGQFITGAPRVFDGKVIIGQGGGDTTPTRGYATAYDAETGKQLWRFYVVPGDPKKGFENKAMEMAAKTWKGEWWKIGGGGEPWNAFTYDAETDTILIGTGNGFPWNQRIRSPGGGDNLFLCSMIAVDAKTGAYKWHYQYNPSETWDYNSTMDMELADLTIDGKPRKVVMSAPKNGFLYVIDRTSGKLISAGKIAKVTWASKIDTATGRPVETPTARFENGASFELWPSYTGAHSWMPMAFSPKTGLVYLPKLEQGAKYTDKGIDTKAWKPAPGTVGEVFDANLKDPLNFTSSLLAWNPVSQQKAWEVKTLGGWNGGILATAGNLVFQGQLDGRFSAYSADHGQELWHFPGQAAILAAPITYRVDGRQYVTVLVGMGSSASLDVRSHGGIAIDPRAQKKRVLTFVLDGKAVLPPPPPPFVLKPVADPGYAPDPAAAAKGATVFGANCAVCHGWDAKAGGYGPDLRGSAVPQSAEAFDGVVRDGALTANGMPKFGELSDADRAAIRQYLRSRAADLRAGKQ
jgi:quinohemoprotein ethanol dehydrogenase